jgi:hypothetical protein
MPTKQADLTDGNYDKGWEDHQEFLRDRRNLNSAGAGWRFLWSAPSFLLFMLTAMCIMAAVTVPGSNGQVWLPYVLFADLVAAPGITYALRRSRTASKAADTAFKEKWGRSPW